MKLGIIALLLSISFSAGADNFINEPDKQKHMIAHAVGANFLHLAGYTPTESFFIMLTSGVMFEMISNENTDNEKLRDIKANVIGASTVFVWEIKF